MFSYIVGVATILLPFGLEKIGDVVVFVYAILIVLGTIVFLIKANMLNRVLQSEKGSMLRKPFYYEVKIESGE